MELTTQVEKIEQEIKSMDVQVEQAIAAIRDERSCDIATKIACECADQVDLIEAQLGPNRQEAKATYENLRDRIEKLKQPYKDWKAKINAAVGAWRTKVKAEIAEANRKALEASAKDAKEKAEREAAKLEKKGEPEMAAIVRDNAACFVPPLQEIPKNKNVVDKVTWHVMIDENRRWELIKFLVGQGPVNNNLLAINTSALKALAKLRHEEMKKWPGLRVWFTETSEVRRDNRRIA